MRRILPALPVLLCTSLACAQRYAGPMRVVHDPHPRPRASQTLRYRSARVPFDALLFFVHDPATGPLPRPCFAASAPNPCWRRFLPPVLAAGPFAGHLDYPFVLPPLKLPAPFFVAGVDLRTLDFAVSPVETFLSTIPFRHVILDASNPTDPHCKTLGDIDGDGLTDALAASSAGGQGLFWYEAAKGWRKHRIAAGNFSVDMQVADLDGDGDLDAVIPSVTQARILWYENPLPASRPDSGPWKARVLGPCKLTHDVEVGDIDRDGDVDVVTREKLGTLTRVWLNAGRGRSWIAVRVHGRPGEGTALGDLDGDGDLDLAHNGFWVETPRDPVRGTWVIRRVAAGWPLDVGVRIADVDADGRADILLGPSETAGGRLSWYRTADPKSGRWVEHTIGTNVSYLHTFQTGDMDGDGDLDVVTAEMHQSKLGRVTVWINHSHASSWTRETIATTGSHNLRLGDIGNDGDLDVFGANWSRRSPTGGRIEYWENRLDEYRKPKLALDRWARRIVDAKIPWRAVFVTARDLDGDRLPDIVAGGHWYRNPGRAAAPWTRRGFGSALANMAAVLDLDGDGDADVIGTDGRVLGRRLAWARNDGKGGFSAPVQVATAGGDFLQGVAAGRLARGRASDVQLALSWHAGRGGVQLLTVPRHAATRSWSLGQLAPTTQNEALSTGDIDRDGDLDLLLGTKWLRNDTTSWSTHSLHTGSGQPDRNRLADVDGDGRLDAVVGYEAASAPERVAWYRQPARPAGTWAEHVVGRITGPMSLDVADMDNDGDIDIIAGEHDLKNPHDARVLIFENVDGRGLLWRSHVVHTGDEHHDGTRVVDIDGDGDLDLVSIGWQSPAVVLYENLAIR